MTQIQYTAETVLGRGRTEIQNCEIEKEMGEITYLNPPESWDEMEDMTLVIDPEGDLWARDETGRDGYLGSNATLTADPVM